jgi:hypothetical protein
MRTEAVERRNEMRRAFGVGAVILLILAGIAIGVGAYHAGETHGLEQAGHAGQIVRVVGPAGGFFPFGLILFPLFFFAIFALVRGAFWRGRWGGPGHHGPDGPNHPHSGPWAWGGPATFEEWHRRQHGQGSGEGGAGGEPAAV